MPQIWPYGRRCSQQSKHPCRFFCTAMHSTEPSHLWFTGCSLPTPRSACYVCLPAHQGEDSDPPPTALTSLQAVRLWDPHPSSSPRNRLSAWSFNHVPLQPVHQHQLFPFWLEDSHCKANLQESGSCRRSNELQTHFSSPSHRQDPGQHPKPSASWLSAGKWTSNRLPVRISTSSIYHYSISVRCWWMGQRKRQGKLRDSSFHGLPKSPG